MSCATTIPEPGQRLRVLCVEDVPEDAELCALVLRQAGYAVEYEVVADRAGFRQRLRAGEFDVVLVDYTLAGWDGLQALQELRATDSELPAIMVTGSLGDEMAVECVKQGASDYVLKQRLVRLPIAVQRALRTRELQAQHAAAERERERLLYDMQERVKEMTCISEVMRRLGDGRSMDEVLQDVVAMVPMGWQYPEITRARLRFESACYRSEPFAETEWKMTAPLRVQGTAPGELAVFYLEARPPADEGPFLREERALLEMLASSIGETLERRAASEAVRCSERKYRELFELANDAILIFEPEQETILEANQCACETYGFTHGELVGTSLKRLTRHVARGERQIAELLATGSCRNFVSEHFRKDGRPIHMLASSKVIEYVGRPAVLTVNRDITELKEAQDALRRAHDELEQRVEQRTAELARVNAELRRARDEWQCTFDCMSEAITVHDPDYNILRCNRAFRAMFPGADLASVKCYHLVHGSEQPPETCPMQRTLVSGRSECCEMFEPHLNQYISVRTDPIHDAEGNLAGIVHAVSDISERKEIERMKSDFVATVSHELRTPLTSLRGFVELMLKREYPPEKRREFLEVILRESQRLTDLVNDVLDLQRIESGQQVFRFEPVSLAEVVQHTADVFAGVGEAHPIAVEIPPDVPLVFADPELVHQVISNLVSNALKYSPAGRVVCIGARAEPGQVLVWVRDEGIGIPPDALSKIFSRFYRVHDTATRNIGGSGLGLALVKEIVEAHGGKVWAESRLHQGSTFYFTLKVAEPEDRAA